MHVLNSYYNSNNLTMARRYLEINGINRIEVTRHHLGEKGFQVWLMTNGSCGFPTAYDLKRNAVREARQIAEWMNIPLEIH